jgi:hypothetical protein
MQPDFLFDVRGDELSSNNSSYSSQTTAGMAISPFSRRSIRTDLSLLEVPVLRTSPIMCNPAQSIAQEHLAGSLFIIELQRAEHGVIN